MNRVLFIFLLFTTQLAAAEWKPPENPDPRAILDEAEADADAGRFEDALAKHIWFHEHALEHRDSLFGVRLSFALHDWHELGKAYPPAMKSLKKTRDNATTRALESADKAAWNAFIDMRSINEHLNDEAKTAEVFVQLNQKKPKVAKKVYELAQPALIKEKKYELCGKYLEPTQATDRMIELYRLNLKFADDRSAVIPKSEQLDYAERSFTHEAATLIGLLVLNKRDSEAEKIAERVRKEPTNSKREKAIAAALKGKLPKPRGE